MTSATPRTNRQKPASRAEGLTNLYSQPLPSNRTGPLYSAFPYPTKISPEAIALFIAAHTKPGDTIYDGFAGSGTTGLAALLCENPTPELKAEAIRLGLNAKWGPRNAELYELSALGAFVSRTLSNPPDPKAFRKAAEKLIATCEETDGWMYSTTGPDGRPGTIRYVIWTDSLLCRSCKKEATLWETCVSERPAHIASAFMCPSCKTLNSLDQAKRVTETVTDPLSGKRTQQRRRSIARIHGVSGSKTWARSARKDDLALLSRIAKEPLPSNVPNTLIPWGDLHRSGYHQGITHLHHFYTQRNLRVFARMWAETSSFGTGIREALRFWLLSYNASHATIMTRVVAKAGFKELVLTSAQPGVLYVSGLPVEKNIYAGLRRKLNTITGAFAHIHGRKGRVRVHQASSCKVSLPNNSIDYIFTDPPFGGNIPYAEINFINEAWLGTFTDRTDEAIVSDAQGKAIGDYEKLLATSLTEARRILKRDGNATLVFHSSSSQIWNALQKAYAVAGFGVERTSVLNKTQPSFKQVTTEGAVRGDPLLLLGKKAQPQKQSRHCVWSVASKIHLEAVASQNPVEQTAQRLYSRLVNHFLSHNEKVPLDADDFYRWHAEQHAGAADRAAI